VVAVVVPITQQVGLSLQWSLGAGMVVMAAVAAVILLQPAGLQSSGLVLVVE
jgi:hypothetical protein